MKKDYQFYKQRHLCVKCHSKDSRTLSGMTTCIKCGKIHADYLRKRRKILIENRQCIECGKSLRPTESFRTCFSCRLKQAERKAARRERK